MLVHSLAYQLGLNIQMLC